jgi:hypothetical protein
VEARDAFGANRSIPEGTELRSADDEKLGKVISANRDFVVLEKGFVFPTDFYIPTSAVDRFDGETAYLGLTKDEVLHQDWNRRPSGWVTPAESRAGATVVTTQPATHAGVVIDRKAGTTRWPEWADRDDNALVGKDVYSADGDKVGTVKRALRPRATGGPTYFLLDPGVLRDWFGGYDEVYLPESAIDAVGDDRVTLTFTKEQVKAQGWTAKPANFDTYR